MKMEKKEPKIGLALLKQVLIASSICIGFYIASLLFILFPGARLYEELIQNGGNRFIFFTAIYFILLVLYTLGIIYSYEAVKIRTTYSSRTVTFLFIGFFGVLLFFMFWIGLGEDVFFKSFTFVNGMVFAILTIAAISSCDWKARRDITKMNAEKQANKGASKKKRR